MKVTPHTGAGQAQLSLVSGIMYCSALYSCNGCMLFSKACICARGRTCACVCVCVCKYARVCMYACVITHVLWVCACVCMHTCVCSPRSQFLCVSLCVKSIHSPDLVCHLSNVHSCIAWGYFCNARSNDTSTTALQILATRTPIWPRHSRELLYLNLAHPAISLITAERNVHTSSFCYLSEGVP